MSRKTALKLGLAMLAVPLVGYIVTMALYSTVHGMALDPEGSALVRVAISLVWSFAYWVMLLLGGIFLAPLGLVFVGIGLLSKKAQPPAA